MKSFMKSLMVFLFAVAIFPMVAQSAPTKCEDCTVVTHHTASTVQAFEDAEKRFPEINSEIGIYEVSKKTQVKILKIQWAEAFLPKGGVDQSHFADGYCGTNSNGTITVQSSTGEVGTVWFRHWDSQYCGL
jgi:hypothetical protein